MFLSLSEKLLSPPTFHSSSFKPQWKSHNLYEAFPKPLLPEGITASSWTPQIHPLRLINLIRSAISLLYIVQIFVVLKSCNVYVAGPAWGQALCPSSLKPSGEPALSVWRAQCFTSCRQARCTPLLPTVLASGAWSSHFPKYTGTCRPSYGTRTLYSKNEATCAGSSLSGKGMT